MCVVSASVVDLRQGWGRNMTPEIDRFKSYVAQLGINTDEATCAAQLGQAKALWAEAATSLPCVRKVTERNKLLTETLKANSKVSLAKGISILKDLGLWSGKKMEDRRD